MGWNGEKVTVGNGTDDWVTFFYDGRVKLGSRDHLWEIRESGRHNAFGEYVRIGVGRSIDVPPRTGIPEPRAFVAQLDAAMGEGDAATIAADNGTFVTFHHDRSITVGNDFRDIEETINVRREGLRGGKSARGGSVEIFFSGTFRRPKLRKNDFEVHIPTELEGPRRHRLYPDEIEITEGKIGPRS